MKIGLQLGVGFASYFDMKSFRFLVGVCSVLALLLMAGCNDVVLSNLTDTHVPQNPSGIYTITGSAEVGDRTVLLPSIEMDIVIDGQTIAMKRLDPNGTLFEHEYRIPKGRSSAKYYLVTRYTVKCMGSTRSYTKTSDMYHLTLMNRYVVSMESARGLIGSTIAVMGRGFTPRDRVYFNHTDAETQFISPNALTFKVPALPADATYEVVLKTINAELPMGIFRIDPALLKAQPSRIVLNSGDRSFIIFSIGSEAPSSGVNLDITTDVPESIIMPAATIPGGAYTVSVPFEGGAPGMGTLYVESKGFESLEIPVEVIGVAGLYPEDATDLPMGEEVLEFVDPVPAEANNEQPVVDWAAPLNP